MMKRANASGFRNKPPSGRAAIGALFLAGASLLSAPGAAQAQQSYYYPQTNQSVTVDLGALAPYGQAAPGMMPYGQMPYGQMPYGQVPIAQAPLPAFGAAPYAMQPYGLPQPPQGTPTSYLNIVGAGGQPIKLIPPGEVAKTKKKKPAVEETASPEPAVSAPEPDEVETAATGTEEPVPPAEPMPIPDEVAVPAAPTPPSPSTPSVSETQPAEATTDATQVPEAPAEEAPAVETPPADQASIAPEAAPAPPSDVAALAEGGTRLLFVPDGDELSPEAVAAIDAVAQKMLLDTSMKIQILAYSSGEPEAESQARRKSLARGLAVRSHLIKQGVPSNRIDVRALGSKTGGEPADRVDIVPASAS
jgi:outer membrane protein OmpA-like peptidoglycan-associated protein